MLFTPFYLPLLGMAMLFTFSYLGLLSFAVKAIILVIVYFFTILLPSFLIHSYRDYQGWTPVQLGQRERRMMPYVISILCYFLCFWVMNLLSMPYLMSSILMAALVIQVVCALINVWWKISTHTAAIGGITGALVAFSFLFNFNPIWWLCITLLAAGLVGTSRMILRQHSLSQVTAGFFVGLIAAFYTIIMI